MFGHPAFLFQLVEKGMRIRQRVGYVCCLVGSLCQQFMESQDRFTADILLLQDTGMVLQMRAGRYACGNAYQCIRTSDEVEFAPSCEFFLYGHEVYDLPCTVHTLQGGIDFTVLLNVEHFRAQYSGNQCDRLALYKAGAEYDFLELGVLPGFTMSSMNRFNNHIHPETLCPTDKCLPAYSISYPSDDPPILPSGIRRSDR